MDTDVGDGGLLASGEDPDPDPLNDLLYSGAATISGSGGNDLLDPENPSHNIAGADEVYFGDGDDTGTVGFEISGEDYFGSVDFYGEYGDDTLTADSYGNSLFGGEGDDALTGRGDNDYFGGVGEDTFEVSHDADQSGYTEVSGGADDDELIVGFETLDQRFDVGATGMNGGAGEDDFTLNLFVAEDPLAEFPVQESGKVVVEDFDPEEDTFTINVSDPESRGLDSMTVETPASGVGSILKMQFGGTAGGSPD